MTPRAAAGSRLTFRIERFAEVASTSDIVRERAKAHETEGLVVVADAQRSGRGRHGRSWHSPPGNLYCSLLLRPKGVLERAASLSLVLSITLAETIEALAPDLPPSSRPRLKWPNDVLLGGAKVAGILLEGQNGCLTVGIGINIASAPDAAPYPVTTLRAHGLDVSRDRLLEALLNRLALDYCLWTLDGFSGFRLRWLERADGLGREVVVRGAKLEMRGRLQGIDEDGTLILEDDEHGRRSIVAGEVVFKAA